MVKNIKKLTAVIFLVLVFQGAIFCSGCDKSDFINATASVLQAQQAVTENTIGTESNALYVSPINLVNPYLYIKDFLKTENADKNFDCETVCCDYLRWLNDTYSSNVITREKWLEAVFKKLDIRVNSSLTDSRGYTDARFYDNNNLFLTAIDKNLINQSAEKLEPYLAVTRKYAAFTLVNAVGYSRRFSTNCEDIGKSAEDFALITAINYGYFELDDNNCALPDKPITADEFDSILHELDVLNKLEGKNILSFGDSIMYGTGNNGEGISDLIAEKYKMSVSDYAVGGATFGYFKTRSQISNQILDAIKNNEKADIILINGGTNDMSVCDIGKISDDFKYNEHGRDDFASGMEYALGILLDVYKDVPIVYIRAHDMALTSEDKEVQYGELAIEISKKWQVDYVDIYSDADFDCDNSEVSDKYTAHLGNKSNGDTVHPTRIGYCKFYLPLTVEKIYSLIN